MKKIVFIRHGKAAGDHLNDNTNSGAYKRYVGAFYDRMLRRLV